MAGRLAPPIVHDNPNELTRITSESRRPTILDHFKQLAGPNSKQPHAPKVRLEIIEPDGVRHVSPRKPAVKGRVEVDDENGAHGVRHFFARLYETGKKVVQKGEDILSGLDDSVINLGPDDNAAPPKTIRRQKRPVGQGTMKNLDEYPVQGKIKIIGNAPVAKGGYCEVFHGHLRRKGQKGDELVAMKRLLVGTTPEHDRKMFRRETNAWNKLHHANILPFYGTVFHKHHIFMVSPWADNGPLIDYLKKNPTADRRALIVQIASALSYVHNECKIIHGDVKGANVFVSSEGIALLADFGLASHIEKLPGVTATGQTVGMAMTPRFSAPELLLAAADAADSDGKVISSIKSRATDVYAFGMTILQVYTLERPWPELNTARVLAQIIQGHKPKKPEGEAVDRGLTPFLWELVEKCLETNPANRPSMAALVVSLADGSVPVGAADLSGEITGQHKESQLLVARRRKGNSGEQVVLKMPVKGTHLQTQKVLQSQIQALALIRHPNILQFYGTAEIGSHLFVVTPWVENGDITTYLNKNPRANRMRLLHQTSDALSYLHSGRASTAGVMVHGSLQPESILINSEGDVKLTDYGLSNLLEDFEPSGPTDTQVDGTAVRFHPPEFFNSDRGSIVPESDVYSFAMVMLQVLTGKAPYVDAKNYFAVINKIIKGRLPDRPRVDATVIDDSVWRLLLECWSYVPENRPSMDQVRSQIAGALRLKLENAPSVDHVRTQFGRVLQPSILDVDE